MKKYKAPYAGLLFTLLNSAEFNCKFVQNGKFLKPEGRDDERLNGLLLRIRESFSKTSHEAIYTRLMKLSPEEIASIKNVDDSAVQATHQSQFSAEIFSLETYSDAIVLLSEEEWNILKPVERHDGKRTRKRPQHWVPKLNEIATTNLAENGIIVNCALVWDFGSMNNTYATGLCNECGMEIQVKCRLTDEKHTMFIKVSVSGNQLLFRM